MPDKLQWQSHNHCLSLRGTLDCATLPSLWQQHPLLLTSMGDQLTMDVSELSRIDSAGLAFLLQFIHMAAQKGVSCRLVGTSSSLTSLLKVYNLLPILAPYLEFSE